MKIGGINLSSCPLFPVLVAVVAGELFADYCRDLVIYGAAMCVALCGLGCFTKRVQLALWSAFLCLGIIAGWISQPSPNRFIGVRGVYSGRVVEVDTRANSQRIVLEAYVDAVADVAPKCETEKGSVAHRTAMPVKRRAVGRTLLYYRSSVPPVETGDLIAVAGVMQPIYEQPAVDGEFTMNDFAKRRGIIGRMSVKEGRLRVVDEASGFMHSIRMMRRSISDAIYASGVSAYTASMLDAVLLGNASELSADVRENFQRAGLAHVLALSGTHVAILTLLISVLFFPLRLAGHRKWSMACVMLCLWFYVLLTGGSPSVLRTVIMVSVVMLGNMLERMHNPFNSLCAAAIAILLFSPQALMSPGFQLSFLAVAGILMFAPTLTFGRDWVRTVTQWLAVTFGAVVATTPLAAWRFHIVPLYFLLANVVVALLLPWFMGVGILLLLVKILAVHGGAFAACAGALVWCVDAMCNFILWASNVVSHLHGAYLGGIYFSAWTLVGWYAAIVAGWRALKTRRWAAGIACGLLLGFAAVATWLTKPRYSASEVAQLRYDYATVVLVRDSTRCVLLTDADVRYHESLQSYMQWRLHDYMAQRGIDSLEVRQLANPLEKVGGGVVAGASHGAVPNNKVDVDGNLGGK
jgi:competence protein ComEC